eukprot:scaffold28886_cov16-Tisochrysis_lutea.AAC.1
MVPHSRGHADRILRHHPWPLVVAEGATCAAFHCTQSTSRGTADETAADVCLPGCGALAVRGRDFRGSEAGCLLLGVDHAGCDRDKKQLQPPCSDYISALGLHLFGRRHINCMPCMHAAAGIASAANAQLLALAVAH